MAKPNRQRGSVMNPKSKVTLAAVVALGLLAASLPATADDVPDGLSVEWQGKKPFEKLFEDAQVLVARCTFPPGTVHVCHSHPSYVFYVLNGGKAEVQDEKGTRKVDVTTGTVVDSPPVPWHELANVGETTLQFLIVEKKYQTSPHVSQTVCPKRTSQ
jgi:quercetin dioxygenase-like cupin family protein